MKSIKLLRGIIIGFIMSIGISSAYILNASEVTYDKKNTTLESDNISGAVNELGVLATTSMSELKTKMDSMDTKIDAIYESLTNVSNVDNFQYSKIIESESTSGTYTFTENYKYVIFTIYNQNGNYSPSRNLSVTSGTEVIYSGSLSSSSSGSGAFVGDYLSIYKDVTTNSRVSWSYSSGSGSGFMRAIGIK